jgi:molecular chaperone HtpG
MFKAQQIPIIILDKLMDNQFITVIERTEKDVHFLRIDANTDAIKENDGGEIEALKKLFTEISGNEKLTVNFSALKDDKIPAILNISEESRRFNDMMKMYAMFDKDKNPAAMPEEATLVLNTSNSLIKKLEGMCSDTPSDVAKAIAKQIYILALVGQRQLTADELSEFLNNSFNLLERI